MSEDGRVVVIGTGPAGCSAAWSLCNAGAEVLMLEAGSERSALGLTVRVRGLTILRLRRSLKERVGVTATAEPNAQLYEELAPGGLSNHWSLGVPRFAPQDFADAERAGEPYAWPIGYRDIAPWYDRVEPLLHIAGAVDGTEQLPAGIVRHPRQLPSDWAQLIGEARETGRTLVPMPYAYGADTTLTLSGTAFNAFVRVARPGVRSGRLTIRYGARVVRLEWSPDKRRVTSVVLRDMRGGTESHVPCRAVVLAAGAIGTAEVLLSSCSADFPEGLGNTHGVLGHYLHDHPLGKLVIDQDTPISIHPACYLTRPELDRAQPLYAAACMQWSGAALVARSILQGKPGRLPWVGFSVFGSMAPSADNWVTRDAKRQSSNGSTPLTLHARHPPQSIEALEKARDDMVRILSHRGSQARVRSWHVEPVGNSVHYAGTCRMHASPQFGMLDRWSRLHAVSNVAVADSSAFTTGPEKNPVLTAMALAARAGDRLAEEMRAGDL